MDLFSDFLVSALMALANLAAKGERADAFIVISIYSISILYSGPIVANSFKKVFLFKWS